MWVDILVPVITALIGAGVVNFSFKWIADRPKNRAHQNKVWEDFKDDTIAKVREENVKLESKVLVCEYRQEVQGDLFSMLMDDMEKLGAPHETMQKRREAYRGIKFAETIDELKQVIVFPPV